MSVERSGTARHVEQALRLVIDPELGENIVDLGLIYRVAVEGNVARVEMTTTTRGCPAAAFLKEAAQSAVLAAPGIGGADVRLTYEPPWTPDLMSDAARSRLHMA